MVQVRHALNIFGARGRFLAALAALVPRSVPSVGGRAVQDVHPAGVQRVVGADHGQFALVGERRAASGEVPAVRGPYSTEPVTTGATT
jgi:hypothetical protein